MHMLGSLNLGPIEFLSPVWLLLVPVLGGLTLWISRKSIAGLGNASRLTAIVVRIVVIAILAGAMAEPQLREVSEDVAISAVIDASRSVPDELQTRVDQYLAEVAEDFKETNDRLGTITVAKDAIVQSLPSRAVTGVDRRYVGQLDGTDLASGIQLALATAPQDAALRVTLFSDGLETSGSLLQAAEAARAANVPIDVMPLTYRYDNEVIVDRVVTPGTAREGETVNIRVVITATRPATGRLVVEENGIPIDLDPAGPSNGVQISLDQGVNVLPIPVPVSGRGVHEFKAVFEADRAAGGGFIDQIVENNTGSSVTFVSGEGQVLVLTDSGTAGNDESAELVRALREAGIRCEVAAADRIELSLTALNTYDAVVMVNQDAFPYSYEAQEVLRQYVHDTGGGLVMVGGDKAFGAGGWIGSPLEDALPIRLDPPQKRQMPRGALALVIHSVEIPKGVFWGKKICEAAVGALSRLDYVGIVEFSWQGGVDWTLPMALKGDGSAANAAIQRLQFGDMPDFDPSLELALKGLLATDAGQRHVIVVSDGDPNLGRSVLQKYIDAGVTISAVGVNPHSAGDLRTMERMARVTEGEYYEVKNNNLAQLPQIFIKEAQTIKRTLIQEGEIQPVMVGGSETLRGIGGVPPLFGYIVAAEREGLAQVTLRGKEDDPIGAQWQYGLGRTVTFTGDATNRWGRAWVGWGQYRQFWEQSVRWAMRPSGSPNVRVTTEARDDKTLIVVEAVDDEGRRLPTATFQGRMATPDGEGAPVTLRQVGPGRFEALVDTTDSGTYVTSMRYIAPSVIEGGPTIEGSVQAAIVKPFADEYRALEDNAALLQQVAEMTGGRVLSTDPSTADLWSRAGLTMPVSTQAIWLPTAIVGIGLFLLDVAIRRVRLDVLKAYYAVRRGLRQGKQQAGASMEGLQAARAKAQQRITSGGAGPSAESQDRDISRGTGHTQPADPKATQAVAKKKFEATDAQVRAAGKGKIALGGEAESPEQVKRRKNEQRPAAGEEEQGMSRLLKAKQRAKDEMQDD
ncbi:MAG: VWA domain-containing protein [Planctomycetota bacterium]|nr:MAG: VWA domain-containing protein [Planctomycetota bacterium]